MSFIPCSIKESNIPDNLPGEDGGVVLSGNADVHGQRVKESGRMNFCAH
jgi:hypothetical protein